MKNLKLKVVTCLLLLTFTVAKLEHLDHEIEIDFDKAIDYTLPEPYTICQILP
jgi:hypothetical protein